MESYPKAIRDMSAELMARECANLKHQIERLEMGRKMQDKRLRNVMNLVGAHPTCWVRISSCSIVGVQQR